MAEIDAALHDAINEVGTAVERAIADSEPTAALRELQGAVGELRAAALDHPRSIATMTLIAQAITERTSGHDCDDCQRIRAAAGRVRAVLGEEQ